ncbi:MAG: hypothetical protein GQ574_14985 [Crocinitomix sp.]|nr:hypothetical protein [Crocinitomix sp.]
MAADDMVEIDNGGYMICGTGFSGFALPQAHVMMIGEDFDIAWGTQYTGSLEEASGLRGVCRMSENEYVVAGYSDRIGVITGLLSGIDTLGNIIWSTETYFGIEEDIILSCVERFDENTVICGGVSGYFGYSKHATIWKINTSGASEWVFIGPGGSGIAEFYDIHLTEAGNIAACGIYDTTYAWHETVGIFMLLDPDGEVLRGKLCLDTVNAYFTGMAELDDAYYLTGPHNVDLAQNVLLQKNYFYDPDTLCGLENIYSGILNDFPDTYLNYEPLPSHGITQKSYFVRTGHGANVSEICSHDDIYGVSIDERSTISEVLIYPNPFVNAFQIDNPQEVIRVQ